MRTRSCRKGRKRKRRKGRRGVYMITRFAGSRGNSIRSKIREGSNFLPFLLLFLLSSMGSWGRTDFLFVIMTCASGGFRKWSRIRNPFAALCRVMMLIIKIDMTLLRSRFAWGIERSLQRDRRNRRNDGYGVRV